MHFEKLEPLKHLSSHRVFTYIPSVEEFEELFEALGFESKVVGYGRCGHPIRMYRAGHGPKRLVLVGFVDPDEPVGTLAMLVLARDVLSAEPKLLNDYTWYLVPIADPCGAKLNEPWFRDPYNTRLYLIERFKIKVIDWKLPGSCNDYVFNEPTPEALAVKSVVDEVRPDFVAALHNNDFSGLYIYLSERIPKLIEKLKLVAKMLGMPLHRGLPEASYLEVYDDGFYREPTLCDEYRNCLAHSEDPRRCIEGLGETVYGYAKRLNSRVLSITCETPYIYGEVLEDVTPCGARLRELYLEMINAVKPVAMRVESIVRKFLGNADAECPYLAEVKEYVLGWSERLESLERRIATDEHYDREASRAEEFDAIVVRGIWNTLLKIGIAMRFISRCVVSDDTRSGVLDELSTIFEELYEELRRHRVNHVPLEKQVAMQLYSVLLSIEYLRLENLHDC